MTNEDFLYWRSMLELCNYLKQRSSNPHQFVLLENSIIAQLSNWLKEDIVKEID